MNELAPGQSPTLARPTGYATSRMRPATPY